MHDIFHHLLGTCGEPHISLVWLLAGTTIVKDYFIKYNIKLLIDYIRRFKIKIDEYISSNERKRL